MELPRRPLAVVADGNAKLNHYAKCGRALTQVMSSRQKLLDCGSSNGRMIHHLHISLFAFRLNPGSHVHPAYCVLAACWECMTVLHE